MSASMIFELEVYVGMEWNSENKFTLKIFLEKYGAQIPVREDKVERIIERVGRISNAWVINDYIGTHCTEWGDTSTRPYVGEDILKGLLDYINYVLEDPSLGEELLGIPSGDKDYYPGLYEGEAYQDELKRAKEFVGYILKEIEERGVDCYFMAY